MAIDSPVRVVIDTNLFFSGLIFKRGTPFRLLEAWRAGAFTLVLSVQQFSEIAEVLRRQLTRDRHGLTDFEIEVFEDDLRNLAQPAGKLLISPIRVRDLDDELILASALAGECDYLIPGDKDLHEVAGDPNLGRLKIVSAATFVEMLNLQK